MNMEKNYRFLMDDITRDFIDVLGDKLAGIYVHGSIAFGCFSWERSDVDFLAVVTGPLSLQERVALIGRIIKRTPQAPGKGIEMSVVTEDVCRNFVYPTPYEAHFSNDHLEAYLADIEGYCTKLQGVDPDLAGHFSVTRAKGVVWYGKPIDEVFGPVPHEHLMSSILNDAEDSAGDGVWDNPVYFILNLCRVIACKEEKLLLSKAGGGEWALENLPAEHHAPIRSALDAYLTGSEMRPDGVEAFRNYALAKLSLDPAAAALV